MQKLLKLLFCVCLCLLTNVSNAITKADQDFNKITNLAKFKFSEKQRQQLIQNNFVINPNANAMEFFEIYEMNRYDKIPNFVTVDSVLHNYHLLYDYLLRDVEKNKLATRLQQLSRSMLIASEAQLNSLKNTPWETAARRNLAFFAVGANLIDQNSNVPAEVAKEITQELLLIAEHHGVHPAIVMNIGVAHTDPTKLLQEDYSQYLPRGHYNDNKKLQDYFRAMMWYGRMTFRMSDPEAIRSAVLITLALEQQGNAKLWTNIAEPINFFIGKSDDLNYHDFATLLQTVYGTKPSLQDLLKSPDKFSQLVELAQKTEPPKINSIPIFNADLQPNRAAAITGFRFLGQRFTIDAAVFQQLMVRAVGPKNTPCEDKPYAEGRMLPMALDFPAALGSKTAMDILRQQGEYSYACYPENMQKLQDYLTTISENTWKQNLYWQWLYALTPLLQPKVANHYPQFMLNPSWQKKDLLAFLGSFTELKHDTLLYVKQVYAEMGDGEEEMDDRGYVEPQVEVYTRLAGLLADTKQGMEERILLTPDNEKVIATMQQLMDKIITIAKKELAHTSLTSAEFDFIRYFGGDLEHLWIECFSDVGIQSTSQLEQKPAAIVTDIATDPNGEVLQEGIGNVSTIYVIIPIDGKPRIASGGVYSYYEFTKPLAERLTDESWKTMVKEHKNLPPMPKWVETISARS